MKFVIQRVFQASVKVSGEIVGSIGPGLLVLVGFTQNDKFEYLDFAAEKLLNIRLWDNTDGVRWKECVRSQNYEILVVSQFTLYSYLKGNKPDFHYALEPEAALKMYDKFVEILKKKYDDSKIQTGKFGEYMEVSLINDGPVTIEWMYPDQKEESNEISEEKVQEKPSKSVQAKKKQIKSKPQKSNPIQKEKEVTQITEEAHETVQIEVGTKEMDKLNSDMKTKNSIK